MTHLDMITVGGYYPLAGRGHNTVRLLQQKYADLRPGDTITMTYTSATDDEGKATDVLAVEHLRVRAISRAKWTDLRGTHFGMNHGVFDGGQNLDALREQFYPGSTEDDEFVAIYFD